jgi:7-cyano-7-deazaguanine synthase in queuosine biosynthesis
MKLIEILDSSGIDSTLIESWIEECQKFKMWYFKLGTQEIDEIEFEKACLRILPKTEKIKSVYEILNQ